MATLCSECGRRVLEPLNMFGLLADDDMPCTCKAFASNAVVSLDFETLPQPPFTLAKIEEILKKFNELFPSAVHRKRDYFYYPMHNTQGVVTDTLLLSYMRGKISYANLMDAYCPVPKLITNWMRRPNDDDKTIP